VPHIHRVASHLARRFHQVCVGVLSEVTEPAGLTPLEYGAVVAIDEVPGIDQRRLAARLAIDAVTAGQIATALEQHGWVERRVDERDRRARRLLLTDAGRQRRRALRPMMGRAHGRILASLTPDEQSLLLDLLARVVESNAPYAKPGNGRRAPRRRGSEEPQS